MILHSLRNSLAALLIVCVMAPGFYLGMAPVPEADADLKQIFGGAVGAMAACVITNLIVAAATHVVGEIISLFDTVPTNESNVSFKADTWVSSAANTMEVFKECILDALAWAAKMIIYETILRAIFAWINQGFDGGPAFLSNPNEFFKKIANATVDAFINNSGLDALLCEPFSATVVDHMKTISISVETEEYACTLDSIMTGDVATEYNNMVQNGSVDTGGIFTAMALSQTGNNAYTAMFSVEAEANSRVRQAQGTEKMLLDFGDGHFSLRCDLNNDGVREVCTPGDFVAKQINEWMGGGLGQLEKADEVSEVVAAAVSMLVQKVLFDTDEGLLSGYIADTSDTWSEYEYGGPQAEEKYVDKDQEAIASGSAGATSQVVWKDPDTGVIWTKSDSGTYISTSGLEIVSDGNGGYKDASTGESVDLGTTVGGVSVGEVLDGINWEKVAVSAVGFAATQLGVPAAVVTAAQIGYGLVTGLYGTVEDFQNGYNAGRLGLTPGTELEQDPNNPNNPGTWDNPDTEEDESQVDGDGWAGWDNPDTEADESGDSTAGEFGQDNGTTDPSGEVGL
jgi:hypothetical protein